jgi:hypothetical protein
MLTILATPPARPRKESEPVSKGEFIECGQDGFFSHPKLLEGLKIKQEGHDLTFYLKDGFEGMMNSGISLTQAARIMENLSFKELDPAVAEKGEIHLDPTIPDGFNRSIFLSLDHNPDLKIKLYKKLPDSLIKKNNWLQFSTIEITYDPS